MAKTGTVSFRDSAARYRELSASVKRGEVSPLYLLMGEEPYFIDLLGSQLAEVLPEEDRPFGLVVVYGKDSEAGAVINLCRQMPMTGGRRMVIVREAQHLKNIEQLSLYVKSPSPSTILVLCHKGKNLDKRQQLYKHFLARGEVFESAVSRDYEIGPWIEDYVRSLGLSIDHKSLAMLADYLGTDISKIANELGKLLTYLPQGTKTITAEDIEHNIGISKDFNNFELTRALSGRDMAKAMLIAEHFARNPKDNPLLVTLGTMFNHFQRIFIVNYLRWSSKRKGTSMPSDMEMVRMLKLSNTFFLKEYTEAASRYPNSKVFAILGMIREYDLKGKGMNAGQAGEGELLRELLLKICLTL